MAFKDAREWMDLLEREGLLARIKAEVDWHLEIGGITQRVFEIKGPALLFENIKDHKDTICKKFFTASLSTDERVCLMLGIPRDTKREEIIRIIRERFKRPVKPVVVDSGPVKENIIKGDDVDLFQFPAPKWHERDGGRFIDTFNGSVTKDPETDWVNVGVYRKQVHDRYNTGITVITGQHNWLHFRKYRKMGRSMPLAVACTWDPVMNFVATSPIPAGVNEYDIMGGVRGEPVELVKCETLDLYVPATAEIVFEGEVTTNFDEFRIEGPFGEYSGYYTSEPNKKPVFKVNCITFRNDPILQGSLTGVPINEGDCIMSLSQSAVIWDHLENNMTGVLGVNADPSASGTNVIVKIDNSYLGQPHQAAALIWGMRSGVTAKNVIVVDSDIDIFDWNKIMWALAYRVNPPKDIIQYPGPISPVDPVVHPEERTRVAVYKGTRLLIDGTRPIENKRTPLWFGEKFAPVCYPDEKTMELVDRRWKEYGITRD